MYSSCSVQLHGNEVAMIYFWPKRFNSANFSPLFIPFLEQRYSQQPIIAHQCKVLE